MLFILAAISLTLSNVNEIVTELDGIMGRQNNSRLKIMIIEDEVDNLNLYKDYFIDKGHDVFGYAYIDNVMIEFNKIFPDISIIDYKLSGKRSGVDVAVEILQKYPWSAVLFVSAYDPLLNEIKSNIFFKDKNVRILIKPIKLNEIESAVLNLVKKSRASYNPYN